MTTATYQTPAPLAAYLRRATLGLSAARREEVWNELEEHVLCRAERLEFTGLSPEEALAQALRELGPPLRVCAGMNGVHNMPKMIAIGTVTMLAVSAGLYALAGGGNVLNPNYITSGPESGCTRAANEPLPSGTRLVVKTTEMVCYQDDRKKIKHTYISVSQADQIAHALDGRVEALANGEVRISFKPDAFPPGSYSNTRTYPAAFKIGGEFYISFSSLVNNFINMRARHQPALYLRPNYLLQTNSRPVALNVMKADVQAALEVLVAEQLYLAPHPQEVYEIDDLEDGPLQHGPVKSYASGLPADEIVVALQVQSPGMLKAQVAEVDTKGNFTLQGQVSKFVADPDLLGQHTSGQPLPTLLVRVTNTPLNNLKSGIFLPK